MKLRNHSIETLAKMVVGEHSDFPYRSSSYITDFFQRCDLDYAHDGSTRWRWTQKVLLELNDGHCPSPDLPPDTILRVISELLEPDDFDRQKLDREAALQSLNTLIQRDGLQAYLDQRGRCFVRNLGTETTSATPQPGRPLSREELLARERVASFLETASEDEFTAKVLVPLFQGLGFCRVTAAGHKE